MKISFCLITLNEEANLARCLQSFRALADEIVVVDSGSTDKTREIAESFGARVTHQDWLGYVGQKNRALDLAQNEWVFSIDGDEELSPELADEVRRIKEGAAPAKETSGFSMPRCVLYEGRFIRHGDWYPDRLVRLFRRDLARFAGAKVHERLELRGGGTIRALRHDLIHHSFRDAVDHWNRCQKYARLWAESRREEGRSCHAWSGMLRGGFRFFRAYFLRRGFMDGKLGFRIAWLAAKEVELKYRLLAGMR